MTTFAPFPGYDPCDGAEPHVKLARDNPCAPTPAADNPLETYESEDAHCTCCGDDYTPRERDHGLCRTCEDFEDFL
jgi:hypothetical protein